jgi:hypothetical protein
MIETTRLKKRIISIALLGFLVVAPSSAMSAKGRVAAGILVPSGTHVLIDGKFGLGEWADARRIASLDSTAIYLKRDAKYLYYQIEVGRLRARHVWLSADVQKGEVTRSIPSDGAERYGRHWLGLRL